MAADRQRVTRVSDWPGRLRYGPAGTAAWLGDIDAIKRPGLAPTPSDLDDAGRRSGEARRLFLARRAALRHLVGHQLELDAETVVIGYDGQGMPRVRAPRGGVFVSVSGRGPIAGLAVSSAPIGIDLEPLETEAAIPWAVLTAAERGLVEGLAERERAAAFLRHWTAKEAYLKACGTGLLRDPADVEVRWAEAGRFSIFDAGRLVAGQGAGLRCEVRGSRVLAARFVARDVGIGASRTALRNRSETGRPRSQVPGLLSDR